MFKQFRRIKILRLNRLLNIILFIHFIISILIKEPIKTMIRQYIFIITDINIMRLILLSFIRYDILKKLFRLFSSHQWFVILIGFVETLMFIKLILVSI